MTSSTGPDYIYHNIVLAYDNNNPSPIQPAVYNANLDLAILENPSEWDMAVVRSNLNIMELPILIPDVDEITGRTSWKVTMEWNGNVISEHVPYIQVNQYVPGSEAFYNRWAVYDYQLVVSMYNATFATLYAELVTAGLPNVYAPHMIFDRDAQRFKIILPVSQFDQGTVAVPVFIRFNHEVEVVFQSFQFSYDSSKIDAELGCIAKVHRNNYFPDHNIPSSLFTYEQDYVALSLWNSVSSVSIRTSMPVQQSYIPRNFADRNNLNGSVILRDYIPLLIDPSTVSRSYIFNSTDEYELNSLTGTSPLKHINASFHWSDTYGKSYQLTLNKHAIISIKLMFRKKKK
jgi:hypothetical protein